MLFPFGIYIVFILTVLFILFLRMEKIRHEKILGSLPIRIWINGTRGKSSVTRLIAAGIRSSGMKVIAKTTGTKARFIMDNHTEEPVNRISQANIHEQLLILKKARDQDPGAVVLECMALRPDLQFTEARRIVKPNIVVITNVRADHLDVMGPTLKDIAYYFTSALPVQCQLVTTEKQIFSEFQGVLATKKIKMTTVDKNTVDDSMMENFNYIEHKENVALALKVCDILGIDHESALKSMQDSLPDPGALRKHILELDHKSVRLVNAMAANDPDSTYLIWKSIKMDDAIRYILINCRSDRIDRSFQMAKLIKDHLPADGYFLTGQATDILMRELVKFISKKKIFNLGNLEPLTVVDRISDVIADNSIIFAIGNTVGYGEELMKEFTSRRTDATG